MGAAMATDIVVSRELKSLQDELGRAARALGGTRCAAANDAAQPC